MFDTESISEGWGRLPPGARAALDEQWRGLAAGALACGAAVVDGDRVIATGRNHVYDQADRAVVAAYPLAFTRIAHAELNALALVPSDRDHARLTLWSTQHPCAMCAAAVAFTGIGAVRYIADDPSDHGAAHAIRAVRGGVPYASLNDPRWWVVANLLFLHTSARSHGLDAPNLHQNAARFPDLVALALEVAQEGALTRAAMHRVALPEALEPLADRIGNVARRMDIEPAT